MKNWMITPDGSAVNLDRVERVTVELRTSHQDPTWYVLARFAGQNGTGVTLAQNFVDRAAAVDWIAEHFGSPSLTEAVIKASSNFRSAAPNWPA